MGRVADQVPRRRKEIADQVSRRPKETGFFIDALFLAANTTYLSYSLRVPVSTKAMLMYRRASVVTLRAPIASLRAIGHRSNVAEILRSVDAEAREGPMTGTGQPLRSSRCLTALCRSAGSVVNRCGAVLAFTVVVTGCVDGSEEVRGSGGGSGSRGDGGAAAAGGGGMRGDGGESGSTQGDASVERGPDVASGGTGGGGAGDGGGLCTDPERCGCDYRPRQDFQSAIPDCSCEYDLRSFDGGTSGLCPAIASMYCMCDELLAVAAVLCSPDGTACFYTGGVCPRAEEICGWVQCWPNEPDGGCPAPPGLVDAGDPPSQLDLRRCASDGDCPPGEVCSLRITNRMFCQ